MRKTTAKNHAGKKHFRLTFIRPTDKKTKSKQIIWEALCDCGKTTYVRPYFGNKGSVKSCGCLHDESRKEVGHALGMKNRIHDPIISSARAVWRARYNDGDINFENFYSLSQLPCYYCKIMPANMRNVASNGKPQYSDNQRENGNFTYNGLDRVDNSKGHTLSNVVPCCKECNMAKGTRTREEFLVHNRRVYAGTTSPTYSCTSLPYWDPAASI